MVKAVNERGVASCSAEVLLNLEAPVFTQPLSNVYAELEDTATFACTVTGKPEPQVVWLANDQVIEDCEKFHIRRDGPRAVLEITRLTEDDSDIVVTCKADNVAGDTETTGSIIVQGIFV